MTVLVPSIQKTRYVTIEASLHEEIVQVVQTWKTRAELAETRAERAEARVEELEAQVSHLIARVNQLEHELYGRKSEKSEEKPNSDPASNKPTNGQKEKKKRKKKSGKKRPDRRNHDHLSLEVVDVDLPEEQKVCQTCGNPFKEFPALEEAETIEIEVKAHRRKIRRRRYMRQCNCEMGKNKVVAALSPGKGWCTIVSVNSNHKLLTS